MSSERDLEIMTKTIRELADELGVSKQRIQQIIKKLSPSKTPSKEGNRYILNRKDVHNIKVLMGLEIDKLSTTKTENRFVDYDLYLDTIESMKEKDEQIKSLLEVQKQTQNLLNQQQQLALQDKKLIEEYKSEIKGLEALNMISHGSEKDAHVQKDMVVENIKDPPPRKNKKWWYFGRRM